MLCKRAAMKETYIEQWSKCFFFYILQKWKVKFLYLCSIITFKMFLRGREKSRNLNGEKDADCILAFDKGVV